MRGSVKIVGHDWTLHLPTGSGYDREVLIDHLGEVVGKHGSARLIAPGCTVSVRRVRQHVHTSCTGCGGAVRRMVGRSGGDRLCMGCIWRRAIARVPSLKRLAATF